MRTEPTQLSLPALADLDGGKIIVAVGHALRQCALDVEDRPLEKANRTVILKINLTPKLDDQQQGVLDLVNTDFHIETKLPKRQTRRYPMLLREGVLMFQPDSPDDPRQSTLFLPDEQAEAGAGDEQESDQTQAI